MLGAIAGDIVGSRFEVYNHRSTEFELLHSDCYFTDDTVLSVAVADTLLEGGDYAAALKYHSRLYPNAGYGPFFIRWAMSKDDQPYGSWGNGAAMRVSPVGFAFDTLEEVLLEARRSAEATHNHPEGIRGAQATASAVFLGRQRATKEAIARHIASEFGYRMDVSIEDLRPVYRHDLSCQGTVPVALRAFLESESFEDALRLAVSVGGDTDTITCITGGIAHAFYGGVPEPIRDRVMELLDGPLADVTNEFCEQYGCF